MIERISTACHDDALEVEGDTLDVERKTWRGIRG